MRTEVAPLVESLLSSVRAALGAQFVGLYLHGSLAGGGFDPETSDVDAVVATRAPLDAATVERVRALHERLRASGLAFADRLEVSYLPLAALRRHDPDDTLHWCAWIDSPFGRHAHGGVWILERHLLRESGVVLAGPPPRELIDPVGPDDLRTGVRDVLEDFWSKQLDDPAFLRPRDAQCFGIVTMCRALYTLERGDIVSKPDAALWALGALPARFRGLVERASAFPRGPQPDELAETLELIRYTLARARL